MEYSVKNTADAYFYTQLFVPWASQSSCDRRAKSDILLAIPSTQSVCGMEYKMRYFRFDQFLIAQMSGRAIEDTKESSEEERYEAYRICLKRCGGSRPASTRTMKRWFGLEEFHKPNREQLIRLFFALELSVREADRWLVQGALEPEFQVNDFNEFFVMYALENHLSYEECQNMIDRFLGQVSMDLTIKQHHETHSLWQAYEQNCTMPQDAFMELAWSMQEYFKGYSITVLEYFGALKDEILRFRRQEYEDRMHAMLSETSYYRWMEEGALTDETDLVNIRRYIQACEKGTVEAPSQGILDCIREYVHILERSGHAQTQMLEELYPSREDMGMTDTGRMQRGEIRIMDDKYLSELLSIGLQKERQIRMLLEGENKQKLQEQKKRCRWIDRHDLLPLIFDVAQRRYRAEASHKEYRKEEARGAYELLANQILTACNMPLLNPQEYELDSVLDVCFGERGMLSLYDILLEYQGWRD